MPAKTAYLRITSTDDVEHWSSIVDDVNETATRAAHAGASVSASVSTDTDPGDEHPERDALLKLCDSWKADADTSIIAGENRALLQCRDELLSTLARLSL